MIFDYTDKEIRAMEQRRKKEMEAEQRERVRARLMNAHQEECMKPSFLERLFGGKNVDNA